MTAKKYRSRKRKVSWLRKLFWRTALLFFLATGFVYLTFFAAFFRVKSIEVRGSDELDHNILRQLMKRELQVADFRIGTSHLLWIDAQKLSRSLLAQYPEFSKVSVQRQLPNKVIVHIQKREPVILVCYADCYLSDKEGIIFTRTPIAEKQDESVLLVEDRANVQEPIVKERRFNQRTAAELLRLKDKFSSELGAEISKVILKPGEQAEVVTGQGWQAFFDLTADVSSQLNHLKAVLEQQIPSEQWGDLEYMDVRFGDKVYYKMRQ